MQHTHPSLCWAGVAQSIYTFKKHSEWAQSFETEVQQTEDDKIWSNLKPAHTLLKRNLQLVLLSDTPLQLFGKAVPCLQDKELIDSIVFCVCNYKIKCLKNSADCSSADCIKWLCCLTVCGWLNKSPYCSSQMPRDQECIISVLACPTEGCTGNRVAV